MTVTININGKKVEILARRDPHSFYTILNVDPEEDDLLGDPIRIGEEKAAGRVVTGTIYINGRATAGQMVYVRTFPHTVIGWKQLHDLGLMPGDTQRDFVVHVPPVLIAGDTDPKRSPRGHLTNHLIADARRVIASWERKGLIERSSSACNAPISLTSKPNGKVKIEFYYADLNARSETEPPHPGTHRPRAIESVTLGRFYSVFRLFYAEWQIPLDTHTKYKTAFTFLGKQYVWNRLPGDYKNKNSRASAALEKVLDQLPQNMKKRLTYFIDTVLISADTAEECRTFTDKLWRHLEENSFQIRQALCWMCEPTVQYLGREITQDGVRLGKDFIRKVKNMKSPRSAKELTSILRCLNDAGQYTPGIGIYSKALSEGTKKNGQFQWDGECQGAWVRLKGEVLVNRSVVPGLGEEPCTVQIFVKDEAWMAQILNAAKKPYRFASGVFPPLKKKNNLAMRELKAMKEVWNKHKRVLESREVEWEVESPEIPGYKDDHDSIPNGRRLNLDVLKSQGCKIKVVPPGGRTPPIPWPQNL